MTPKSRMWTSIACALALTLVAGCAKRQAMREAQARQQMQMRDAEARQQMQMREAEARQTQTPPAGAEGARSGAIAAEELSDEEVAKVLDTVNRGEIQQAELAVANAQNPEVRDYAERMLDEHRRALERTTRLVAERQMQPRTNAVDQQLARDGQTTVAELGAAEGSGFDQKYISSQVETHRKVLELIDSVLLPSTDDPQLRAEIEAVRPVIASHLAHAEQIQQTTGTTGG